MDMGLLGWLHASWLSLLNHLLGSVREVGRFLTSDSEDCVRILTLVGSLLCVLHSAAEVYPCPLKRRQQVVVTHTLAWRTGTN